MEPEATLPALPDPPAVPAPSDPLLVRLADDMGGIMDRAYLESVSRTDPRAFLRFASAVLGMKVNNHDGRAQTVVNVVNAIPRSPLDGLPPGFTIK